MSRRVARLTSDFGIDPERQNLSDGSWKWPSVRQMLGYASAERRLERAIVKELLAFPEAKTVSLSGDRLRSILGSSWESRIIDMGKPGLTKVALLVCESCVRVSVRFANGAVVAQVY